MTIRLRQPIAALLLAAALCFTVAACSAPPEEAVAKVQSAVTIHSTPPAGSSWANQEEPWLCSPSTWNPIVGNNWPPNGWCSWQPDPNSDIYPWNVSFCTVNPDWAGSIQIYSEENFGGDCAQVFAAPGGGAFQWNVDLVEVNGWHSIWTPPGGTPQFKGIKSMKVANHTSVLLCNGPFTGPSGAPCNLYPFLGISNTSNGSTSYPHILTPGGLFFEVAAFQIQAL